MPFVHPLPYCLFGTDFREQIANDGDRVRSGGEYGFCISARDSADGHEWLGREFAPFREPIETNYRIRIELVAGSENGTERDVVDGFRGGLRQLVCIMGGEAQSPRWADQLSRGGCGKIVLAYMQTGVQEHGEIGTIVDDELCSMVLAKDRDGFGIVKYLS